VHEGNHLHDKRVGLARGGNDSEVVDDLLFRGSDDGGEKRGNTNGEHAASKALNGIAREIVSVEVVAEKAVHLQVDQTWSEPCCFIMRAWLNGGDAAIGTMDNAGLSAQRVAACEGFIHWRNRILSRKR
jgi:hypothetical protein